MIYEADFLAHAHVANEIAYRAQLLRKYKNRLATTKSTFHKASVRRDVQRLRQFFASVEVKA